MEDFELIDNSNNLFPDDFESKITEMNNRLINDLIKKKDDIFFQRLKELGIKINIEEEEKRRFKSFVKEVRDNEEIIFYNDGSIDGQRVITFVTKTTPFHLSESRIGFETTYY